MVVANNTTQWAELEPKKGFNFENYERNINLIKDKVIEITRSKSLKFDFRKYRLQSCTRLVQHLLDASSRVAL